MTLNILTSVYVSLFVCFCICLLNSISVRIYSSVHLDQWVSDSVCLSISVYLSAFPCLYASELRLGSLSVRLSDSVCLSAVQTCRLKFSLAPRFVIIWMRMHIFYGLSHGSSDNAGFVNLLPMHAGVSCSTNFRLKESAEFYTNHFVTI